MPKQGWDKEEVRYEMRDGKRIKITKRTRSVAEKAPPVHEHGCQCACGYEEDAEEDNFDYE